METQLRKDLISAMKEKNKIKKETIQLILADFKNESIKLKRGLTSEEEVALIKKQLKQVRDAKEFAEKANREDLIIENNTRIEIIPEYLPKMLTKDEILSILETIPDAKTMNRGQLIKTFMADHKAHAEGKLVSESVMEFLA